MWLIMYCLFQKERKKGDGREVLDEGWGTGWARLYASTCPTRSPDRNAELSSCLRVPHVYHACMGVKNYDSEPPLMMYISKLVPTYDEDRVFFGKITIGMNRMMGPNFGPGLEDLCERSIQRAILMVGSWAGNTFGLVGVEQLLVMTVVVTTFKEAHSMSGPSGCVKNPNDTCLSWLAGGQVHIRRYISYIFG